MLKAILRKLWSGKNKAIAKAVIEGLESRSLLSASVMTPDLVYLTSSSSSSSQTVSGYTPAEIAKAYNFDLISSISGAAANGAGQTIAIVDAYNDPNITSDLNVFDTEFGIAAVPSLKIVNQTGGTTLPSTDGGWAGEIALDVEWAHAMAPGANILLVEAASSGTSDLMAAVNYARKAAGVSVVSMSWGGSEFFSWGQGGESSSQLNYDSIFTTPSGHQGVTFVASAGDSGSYSGVQWPASSPNVLSVGGTTLTTTSTGAYSTESSWSGTNGGYSQVEVQPSYQDSVQSTGARSVPDVSYNADPNTGFAIYDSLAYQGTSGWQEVGGTSAGAPQWAALIAIADQSRAAAGETSLDGPTQTLPMLYDLYSAPSTSGYSTYTTYFNDVIDQTTPDPWQWWWGGQGQSQGAATSGYDDITGLGTPHANTLITALTSSSTSGSGSSGSSGSTGSSGSGGTTTTPQTLPDSPIIGAIISALPGSVMAGAEGSVKIDLINTSATKFTGPITISLYATTDGTISSTDTAIATLTISNLKLGPAGMKIVKLNFAYPSASASESVTLVAQIAATSTDTNPTQAVAPTNVTVAPATVDLATAFASAAPIVVKAGANGTATVTITNDGSVAAIGTISVSLYASDSSTVDSSASLIGGVLTRSIKLKAGHSITLHIRFAAPLNRTPGNYNIVASTASALTIADSNASNDVAAIATVS